MLFMAIIFIFVNIICCAHKIIIIIKKLIWSVVIEITLFWFKYKNYTTLSQVITYNYNNCEITLA